MDETIIKMAQALCDENVNGEIKEVYRKALDNIHALVIVISMHKKVLFVSNSLCKILGKPVQAYQNCSCQKLDLGNRSNENCAFNRLVNEEKITYFTWQGEDYKCESSYLYDTLGNKIGFVEHILPRSNNVGPVDKKHSGINTSCYDELTGLFQRDYFCEMTRKLLDLNPQEQYVLVYCNIKRFKVINDVFSPKTGDMVLISLGNKIKKLVENIGTAARLADDKFIFCVPKAKLKKEWVMENAIITLISDTAAFSFNSTFGLYKIKDRTISVNVMCDRAKMAQQTVAAVHFANAMPYAYYDAVMRKQLMEEQYLLSQMNYALQEKQFKLYIQPVYDMKAKKIISSEALVRWKHPEKGLISPGQFINIFEKNGLITQLDRYIWDAVGSALEKRLKNKQACVPISINVSRVDFFTTTLLDDLDDVITKHNLPRKLLRVEVTESAYADDPTRIMTLVKELRARNFTVLLDDFGSGYSSLNTLKDIPLDILKIDMKFLNDFETSNRAGFILDSIITMARRLEMGVIAEGVETQQQAEFLLKAGCRNVQGFLFAKPMPLEAFFDLLDAQN